MILDGPSAQGRLSVDYLAVLAKELQTTLRRIAANQQGKTGRFAKEIEAACSLELVGFSAGSVHLDFELAALSADRATLWPDAGRQSLDRFIEILEGGESAKSGWAEGLSSSVISGLERITRPLENGIASMAFALAPGTPGGRVRSVRVTRSFREVIRAIPAPQVPVGRIQVTGVIWEADWKQHSAELHRIDGHVIRVRFDAERDEEVTEARRSKVIITGTVIAGDTQSPREVQLDQIEVLEAAPADEQNPTIGFWEKSALAELALRQGVIPPSSLSELGGDLGDGDDLEEFLASVRRGRL